MANEDGEEGRARRRKAEEIYRAAGALDAAVAADFVARACAGDAELYREVVSLIAADSNAADLLRELATEPDPPSPAGEVLNDTVIMSQLTPPSSSESTDLLGAKVAGRYQVVARLGGGGFGDVYKALDEKIMSRPVVIKVLKPDVLKREGATRDWLLNKFRQEIEALSRIRDPGVVGVFDADTLPDGRPYLVMEFVEGSDLRRFINGVREEHGAERGLELEDVAEIVKQVGRTLTAAHDENIIHRDLKPENIMLRRSASGDLQVKVIDFGVAKVRNSLIAPSTTTGRFMPGTWLYMAPEQLRGKKVSAASDVYALGVVAYELVTGRHPFAARDPAHVKELQEAGVKIRPCDLNPELPGAAQAEIIKALSYYPHERHRRARDFGDGLARALTVEQELRPPHPPLRRKVWLLAAVAVMLVAAVSLAVLRGHREGPPTGPTPQTPPATPTPAAPARTLTYWLTVRRKHDTEPFPSIGEKIFDAGSEFRFNVRAAQAGALYIFSEGKNDGGAAEWNTMFPTRANNNGDPWLRADLSRTLRTNEYVFAGQRGTVKVWVIWAEERVELLDEIVESSLDADGVIRDPARLESFIEQHRSPPPEIIPDRDRFTVTLKGSGGVLIDLRELEYQP